MFSAMNYPFSLSVNCEPCLCVLTFWAVIKAMGHHKLVVAPALSITTWYLMWCKHPQCALNLSTSISSKTSTHLVNMWTKQMQKKLILNAIRSLSVEVIHFFQNALTLLYAVLLPVMSFILCWMSTLTCPWQPICMCLLPLLNKAEKRTMNFWGEAPTNYLHIKQEVLSAPCRWWRS